MRIVVLGSAAGGGLPQWNCGCANCRRARAGDPAVPARTQSSIAVSADGLRWALFNASPDLRQQVAATPALAPPDGALRGTPLASVVLTNADIDHVAGLLSLREAQPFALYASGRIHAVLEANPIFDVLDRDRVPRRALELGGAVPLSDAAGAPIGLEVTLFPVPGKVPLWLEGGRPAEELAGEAGDTVGVEVTDGRRRLLYVPACARVTPALLDRLHGADLLLFDGTLWDDEEMVRQGLGPKTGPRMGHLSVGGPQGSIAALREARVRRRAFIHLNNSNPLLAADTPERAAAAAAGWEVASDGQEFIP
ncbi:pyrroloquinoline quinone biosynthesis protein PqqB [Arenibaculum pallidiluteum]|uniref:pyrroloquinoline quinone biosynthesis protein PqqB n=1 Tax=Arenibaculum pallidiluteum TaxID=2812559 RepID=UPI001A973C59|nr:pyrroloquinoline quinone biosynthesis protein PqqB [Arenibaculum pallidiluteum]